MNTNAPHPPVDSSSMDPDLLVAHGWDDHFAAAFAAHASPDSLPVRVLRAERGACLAIGERGPVRVELIAAHHTGPEDTPTTGDWLAVFPPAGVDHPAGAPDGVARPGGVALLDALLPRRTTLARGSAAGTSRTQLLAANVDTVVIAVSLAAPLRHTRTERLLALAWESGATPVLALTKADACEDPAAALAELGDVALGVDVVLTSAARGEGIEELRGLTRGTVALIGPSGAGKSTLGNALLGQDLLATGEVREADGMGKHTTAWRELLPLPGGGVLLDTPGLRAIGLTGSQEGLERTFEDIEELALACRFADCAHGSEPGCAVLAALASGALSERRLESYRKLLRENRWQASRTDARLRQEIGAQYKSFARSHRALKQDLKRRDTGR